MKNIKLTNWGIIILIILLTLNIIISLTGEPKSSHAAKTIQYKVIDFEQKDWMSPSAMQDILNKNGAEGWEIAPYRAMNGRIIFKK